MAAIDYLARTDTVHIATELPDGSEVEVPVMAAMMTAAATGLGPGLWRATYDP